MLHFGRASVIASVLGAFIWREPKSSMTLRTANRESLVARRAENIPHRGACRKARAMAQHRRRC